MQCPTQPTGPGRALSLASNQAIIVPGTCLPLSGDPEKSLPKVMSRAGYETWHCGKPGNEYSVGLKAFDTNLGMADPGSDQRRGSSERHADAAIIITNPEVSSVRDSDRIIGLLDSKTARAEKGERVEKHLLLTRYDPIRAARGDMLTVEDVLEILSIPLLGIIPESQEVLKASNMGVPVTLNAPLTPPARAYADAVRRLRGEEVPMTVPQERRGLVDRLFGRRVA